MKMINNLTNQHEAKQEVPWAVADTPAVFTKKMVQAIVGLEIEVSSMLGKWKVSQNQSKNNKLGVIAGLFQETDSDAHTMADFVKALTVDPL
jgi:transcriptional regulator